MRKLIRAALVCTVVWPGQASADPVTSFVLAISGTATAVDAALAVAAGGLTSAAFAVGSFLGTTMLGRLVLSVGLGAAYRALNKPKLPQQIYMGNFAQPAAYMTRGYGRVKLSSGVLGFTGFANNRRHYTVLVAAHSTKGPVEHWLDKTQVEVSEAAAVTTAPITGYGSIRTYTGKAAQAVDATLLAAFPGQVTTAFDYAGLSYAALYAQRCAAESFTTIYPNQKQWDYLPVWDMSDQVYDPRTGARGWTDNAALIIAAEAIFYGKSVDWDNVAAEADKCDALVLNGDGALQKTWTINAVFSDDLTWENARNALALACDAFFTETPDGKVMFNVGGWAEPTITLTDADFTSIQIAERAWGPDVAGEFQVTYSDPLAQWTQQPAAPWIEEAGKPRHTEEVPIISNHNQAVRIEKRLGRVARARYAITGTLKLIGYELQQKRFARLVHQEMGFDIYVEIDKLVANADGISFSLSATSTLPEDHAFVAATEEPPRPVRAQVISSDDVAAIAALSGTAVADTGGAAAISWAWAPQDASLVQQVRMRCVELGIDWQTYTMNGGQAAFVATGLADGKVYEAQVRNRTNAGRVSTWGPDTPTAVTAVANTVAPSDLSAAAVAPSGGDVLVSWTAPDDANYYASRVYRADGSTSFGSAALVHTEYGLRAAPDSWTDAAPGAGDHAYWLEPINSSGAPGTRVGPLTVTLL